MRSERESSPRYKTEAALCADFISWAEKDGWTAYAETAGWDLILVKSDIQFGIQAKLKFNATLLRQVMPVDRCGDRTEPNHRGILIPKIDIEIDQAMRACSVVAFAPTRQTGYFGHTYEDGNRSDFAPSLNAAIERGEWPCEKRIELPDYVPDVVAGASSPVQLTQWKISALRICVHIELHGFITSRQIREKYGVDSRRWIDPGYGWLSAKKEGENVVGYVAGPKLKFPQQHPDVYAKIKSEMVANP